MKQIYHRSAQLDPKKDGSELIPCVLSTDTPYQREDYTEILVHTQAAIDLSRAPIPFIESHDTKKLNIGVIEQLIISGGKLRGMLRMGGSARGKEVLKDIQAGIVTSLSVGYRIDKWTYIKEVVTATRWQLLETSAVAVPADPNAGFYRNLNLIKEHQMNQDDVIDDITHSSRGQRKRDNREFAGIAVGAETERLRIREITALCTQHKVDQDFMNRLIDDSATVETARGAVLSILQSRSYQQPSNQDFSGGSPYDYAGSGSHDYGFGRKDMQEFSICRAIAANISKDWRGEGLERSMSNAIAQKLSRETEGVFVPVDLPMGRGQNPASNRAYSVGGSGGILVETQLLASSFIDMLRNQAQVLNLGATFLTGLVGNVDIPRRATGATTYWVGESGNVTNSTGTLEKMSLTPRTVGALCTFSRKMILQSTPDIDMLIRQDFVEGIALAIDLAALFGTGTNQPTGIFNTSGIGSVVGGTRLTTPAAARPSRPTTWRHASAG